MPPTRILCGCLLLLCHPLLSNTFPTGAGACPERRPAVGGLVGGPHTFTDPASTTTGPLSKDDIQFWLNGTVIPEEEWIRLPLNTDIPWVLSTNGAAFRGFLIRLGGGSNQVDTSEALASPSIPDHAQLATACVDVGGITHTDKSEKTSITGSLAVTDASSNMPLDVTVVIENSNGVSTFYHTTFEVDALEDVDVVATIDPRETTFVPSTSAPTQEPKELWGDSWAYGQVETGRCFAVDSNFYIITHSSGCGEISHSWEYYNQLYDEDGYPMGDRVSYAHISAEVNYCTNECRFWVNGNTCKCSAEGDRVTVEDCNDDALPTPQTGWVGGEGGASFEFTQTDDMCNHPAVVGTSVPTEEPYHTCGDAWASGEVQEGQCFAVDSSECTKIYPSGCAEISQYWEYYNQLHEDWRPVEDRKIYMTISVSVNTCTNECTLTANRSPCECSIERNHITMEDCIDNTIPTPQTVEISDYYIRAFAFTQTDEMCNHPAVIGASESTAIPTTSAPADGDTVPENTRVLKVPSRLTYYFASGTGADVDPAAKTALFAETTTFFKDTLKQDATFKHTLQHVSMDNVDASYGGGDTWIVSFATLISVDKAAIATQSRTVRLLAAADWDEYVHQTAHPKRRNQPRHENGSVLDHVVKVKFHGIGFGK